MDTFTHYTAQSGLPSNGVHQVYIDKYSAGPRTVYFATDDGIGVYTGP